MLERVIARIHRGIAGYMLSRQVHSRVSRLLKQGGFASQQLVQALDRIERRSGALESLQTPAASDPPRAA